MAEPVNMAAPVHKGRVLEYFSIVHNRSTSDFRAGETVTVDGFTRRAMEAISAPVEWLDGEVVPGMTLVRPLAHMGVDAMRPGVIYAADAVDPGAAKAAFKFGKLARVTVDVAGAEPVAGWILAR